MQRLSSTSRAYLQQFRTHRGDLVELQYLLVVWRYRLAGNRVGTTGNCRLKVYEAARFARVSRFGRCHQLFDTPVMNGRGQNELNHTLASCMQRVLFPHLVGNGHEIGSVACVRIATIVEAIVECDDIPRWQLEMGCPDKVLGAESSVRSSVSTAAARIVRSVLCVRSPIQRLCYERDIPVAHRVAYY